jgi:SagB-type dehydrogenase family enzyme
VAGNADVYVARNYHGQTAHSYRSVRSSGHSLDWDTKPFLFKIYPDLPSIELPRSFPPLSVDALSALGRASRPGGGEAPADDQTFGTATRGPLTLETLAAVLFFSAGLTRKMTYPGGGETHFRAAPSTGALYQTEVYVISGPLTDLPAGVYHFSPGDFRLRRLREGDFRQALAEAAAAEEISRRPLTVVLSAIYWRNTWKYQARGYRHFFWDSGTLLANLLAAAGALGLGPRLLAGFVDSEVNALLGLDAQHEAALVLVVLGPDPPSPSPDREIAPGCEGHQRQAGLPPIHHSTIPLSTVEVDYPLLREMHAASMLADADAVRGWRPVGASWPSAAPGPSGGRPRETVTPLLAPRTESGRTLGETILKRGSTRQFSHQPLTALELSTVLHHATGGFDADVPAGLCVLYLVINAVESLPPGAYRYRRDGHALELVRTGEFRAKSAYLCLEQALGGDAAAVIYFLAPLPRILGAFGNRGYRLANLEAGLTGGRAYLAAYAQGFGASGLTFYDGDVVEFFGSAGEPLDAIFVTALGRSARGPARAPAPLRITR